MTDIKHLQDDVAYVRTHIGRVERMLAHQLRHDPVSKEEARKLFEATPDLARTYLAFTESANQKTIGERLGLDKSKVSRLIVTLTQFDFLRKLDDGRYMWTEFHQLIGLERIATAALKHANEDARKTLPEGSVRKRVVKPTLKTTELSRSPLEDERQGDKE